MKRIHIEFSLDMEKQIEPFTEEIFLLKLNEFLHGFGTIGYLKHSIDNYYKNFEKDKK